MSSILVEIALPNIKVDKRTIVSHLLIIHKFVQKC